MKKWKYLKGTEVEFNGAFVDKEYAIKRISDGRTFFPDCIGDVDFDLYNLIGHRQLAGDDEQDLNDCIGSTEALITERSTRYGKFKDGAEIMQSLKDVMREVDGWNELTASQKEALEMIQHKVGRILNGDQNYDDSWKDIAGYATLIVNELNGEIK